MIREVLAEAWADSCARTLAAVAVTPFVVAALWFLTVVYILAGTPT